MGFETGKNSNNQSILRLLPERLIKKGFSFEKNHEKGSLRLSCINQVWRIHVTGQLHYEKIIIDKI